MDVSGTRIRSKHWNLVTPGAWSRVAAGRWGVLAGWQSKLSTDAAFTHLTAVSLLGWWMPRVPEEVPVFVQLPRHQRVRRRGLRAIRVDSPYSSQELSGLRIAAPEDVLLACARDLGVLDLAVVLDGALRAGVPRERIEAAAAAGRGGACALRAALARADPRAESPWETMLRIQHRVFDVPVVPQHRVEHEGVFVARADLWIAGTRTLQEYDGAVHRSRGQHRLDLDRERRLSAAGWVRNGFTERDLIRRPAIVLRSADRALGRETDVQRLAPWFDLLHDSGLTEVGRGRLRDRWASPRLENGRSAARNTGQKCQE